MQSIAIDICNTIADINSELEEYFGAPMKEGIYYYPNATKEWFLNNLWIYEKAKPIPLAKEALNIWSNEYEIIYLTARPKKALPITKKWLAKNGFPKGKLISSTDKAKVYKKFHCAFAVDDSPSEIANYLKNDCNVKVVKKHYTKGFDNLFSFEDYIEHYKEG